jgi:IS5 family transposase
MSRRDQAQASFVDALVSGYGKVGGFLDRIEKGFDWPAFEPLLSPIHGSATGAPGYPPLTMFKILLLSNGTRSPTLARRRRSTTGCRFAAFAACRWRWRRRTTPRSGGFARRSTSWSFGGLLAQVNRQFDTRGLDIQRGTLVDATIIAGAVRLMQSSQQASPLVSEAPGKRLRNPRETEWESSP